MQYDPAVLGIFYNGSQEIVSTSADEAPTSFQWREQQYEPIRFGLYDRGL